MNKPKVGIISLGCCRNLVDSQIIVGRLKAKGYIFTDILKADIGILNTCAFIKEAKEESLAVIQQLVDLKKSGQLKKLIVTGCLPQRYYRELTNHIKEIDAFVGRLALEDKLKFRQQFLTAKHFAYVKICESCFNKCSYCVIPQIRGTFKSRSVESIICEVKSLDRRGVKEINLIGQDTTAFGRDLPGKVSLAGLLPKVIAATRNIEWVRLLYTHPRHFDDALLKVYRTQGKLCKYIDLPLQHINDRILKRMNRHTTKNEILRLLDKIRKALPGVAIRTSIIVGFPGETDKEFQELIGFIEEQKFERLGAFVYSREETTPAYHFRPQVPEKIKHRRFDFLMQTQQVIAEAINRRFLNQGLKVLIDEPEKKNDNIYLGRTEFDAPEVDGVVHVHSRDKLSPGDLVSVKIIDTLEYDLVGERVYGK